MAKVKIIKCTANHPEYANLKPESKHEVLLEEPYSVWVKGVSVPIRIMKYEYEWVDD